MLKRMISLLLCAVMLITMLPAQTMAMETEETEVFLEETESVPEETETVPEENTEPTTEETVAVTEPTVAEEPAAAETTGPMVENVIVTEVAAESAMGSAEVMAAAAVAQGTCGTDLTWTFNEDTGVLRISGTGAMSDYTSSSIPWCDYGYSIKSVVIEEGVTSIGRSAFSWCTGLTSVTIPESVTRIGAYAFSRCDSLTGIWVSPDNKDYSSDASGVLFDKNQKQLIRAPGAISGTYLCPETVTGISGEAFAYCAQLNSVTIPDRVTSIGNEAFSACSGLVGVSIGSGVSSIGASAFNGCALTSVTIPASVTNIGLCAFYDCNNLTGIWVEESNAYYSNDDRGVLFDKEQTKLIQAPGAISGEYICPASVTSIESYAFGKCANLTNVVFPEHVSIIDAWAFHSCTGLTAVTIPASVVSLSVKTFNCCTNLGAITFQGDAPTFSINTFSMVTATAYYPAGNTTWTESVMQDYEGTITWIPYEEEPDSLTGGDCGDNATWELDDNGVLTISGIGAMEDYTAASEQPWAEYQSGITEIVIGDDVTKIGAYAFSGCDQAVTLTIGEGVTEIGNYAFYNCTGLTQVNYNAVSGSDSVSDNYSFCYAGQSGTGITVTVGSEVERIPAYLFSPRGGTLYSPNIIKLEFEENSVCTEIGHHAFYYVKYMKQIEIPASMTSIGKYAFYHTEELERLDFYAVNMEDLGSMNYVFYEAGSRSTELTVYFGAQVQRIPAYLFCANSGSTSPLITEVVFAENSICQEIGGYAFHWVDKLRDMEIPVSVTKIGDYAFEYCGNLTLLFPEALPEELGEDWSAGAAVCVNPQKRGMTENGFTYWITQDDEAVIGKYRGTETDVTVPAVIENCPVVDVSDGVFYYNEEIVSVILPDGIKRIGISAFEHCGNLQQVIIPDTVEYIEGSAFYYCSSLETVILPKNLRSVGNGAFGYGSGYYRFTGNAPWIDSSAFSNATATLAYPANDPTWENAIQKNYSGEITWEPYETCENGHQYEAVYTDPTFDANGFTTYTCSVCGDTYTETDEGTMKSAAASIGSVKYETLAGAFAAAKEGDTILMLKTYTIAKRTAETWDLSGKTLEISGGRGGISVEGNLTVLGGTFRFLEGVQGIMVWANGQVTIENGTFHTVDSRGIWAVYGKITFNGGTFYTTGEGYIGTSERQAGTNKFAQFLINGGTFYFRDSGHFVDYGNSTIKGGTFYLESREGSIRADYSYHRDSGVLSI